MRVKYTVLIAVAVLGGLLPVALSAGTELWLNRSQAKAERRASGANSGVEVPAASNASRSPRYLPHLVQGQGWETRLHVINVCSEAVGYYSIGFFGDDGRPKRFSFSASDPERSYIGINNGTDDPLPGRSVDIFILPDTGAELLQGFGKLIDDGGGCVGVDIEFRQNLPTGEVLFSTVPAQRQAFDDLVLSLSGSNCDIGVAIAGTGGAVQVEASSRDGAMGTPLSFDNLYHSAFQLNEWIPGPGGAESLHISGAAAAVGLEFCQGRLAQFRLPYPVPRAGTDTDGDGVLDHLDAFPTDPARTSPINGISTTVDHQILVELKPEDTQPANLFDLNERTLVFTPDGRGGYSRDVRSLEWEQTLGTDVTLEWEKFQDGVEVEFGDFEFDYAGRRWNSVFMSKHGLLTFGAPLEYSKHFWAWRAPMSERAEWLATTPTISALYKPAFGGLYGRDPLASQFVARFPDRVVVTWFASEYDAYRVDVPDHAERFQTVLYADGAIQFNYGRITVRDGVVGLFSDVVEKGDLIAFVADATDPGLPGHLDLLEVALYETDADTVILEFTTREPIPEPTTGFYNYRLFFDTDPPYSQDSSDIDLVWKIEIGGDHSVWGGNSRTGDRPNRIELVADIGDLQGLSASVWAGAHEYDDNRSFVRGDGTTSVSLRLPTMAPVDLSAPDRRSSRTQREVFHHRILPEMAAIACRIIENLGDRFDLFFFYNEFRYDLNKTGWRGHDIGVSGTGRKWEAAPCGDGRLMGLYQRVVRIQQAGGRIHDWRNANFEGDLTLFAHELTHSWTAYLSYVKSNGARGRLFADSFADGCRCHWRGELHAPAAFPWGGEEAHSLMMGGEGGGFWRDNGDGTFTAITDFGGASGLSWLDLYAMGLVEASEVPDLFVLRNLEPAPGNDNPRPSGYYRGTFYADKEIISIDQIVAAEGPREPPAARSRKEFNTGFVYLLEPGQTPAPEPLQLHKDYIDRVIEYWSHVTGGRSRITVAVTADVASAVSDQ